MKNTAYVLYNAKNERSFVFLPKSCIFWGQLKGSHGAPTVAFGDNIIHT